MKKHILPPSIILLVIALDQWLKFWVKGNMDYMFNSRQLPQDIPMTGDWFHLHFVENNGMAFGLEMGGETGKLFLTIFRILAVGFGFWYLNRQLKDQAHTGFVVCVALIIAGAVGNIIDSVFYGLWFADVNSYQAGLFQGQVVDMLYFPVVETHYPSWFPFWGGEDFTFFSPVFNLADASISVGVITLVLFQNLFFRKPKEEELEAPDVVAESPTEPEAGTAQE